MQPSKGLKFSALGFLERAAKVRSRESAQALFDQYNSAFEGEPWWAGVDASATVLNARTLLAPWQLAQREPSAKADSEATVRKLAGAGFPSRLGSVGAPLRSEDESARPQRQARPAARVVATFLPSGRGEEPQRKGFGSLWEAEQWALRTLDKSSDPQARVEVKEAGVLAQTWTYAEACRRSTRYASPGTAMHHSKGPAPGPWQRVGQTKVTFSRG